MDVDLEPHILTPAWGFPLSPGMAGFPSDRNMAPESVVAVSNALVLAFREAAESRIPVDSSEC